MEEWRNIEEYKGLYQVSDCGRVKSLDRWITHKGSKHFVKGRILKLCKANTGYMAVGLFKNGKGNWYLVHRLVAEAFLDNPDNLPCINHKDEDKTNNNVTNLEWCSYRYNANYGTKMKRISDKLKGVNNTKLSKTVYQYTLDGEFVKEWPSVNEIKRQIGYDCTSISACCRGKCKSAYKYIWRYKIC